ncbi:hypothetical protein VC33_18395 [Pseudomonas fluorescens]|nr:hypothetical protein VC33_18395 [Pseudomonas fluorescens]OOG15054.1 hypothetical protein BMS17_24160 [Pseudomonas sp. C9]
MFLHHAVRIGQAHGAFEDVAHPDANECLLLADCYLSRRGAVDPQLRVKKKPADRLRPAGFCFQVSYIEHCEGVDV